MPIARVQLPDGRIGRFEVPEGTTPEQVLQYAQSMPSADAQPAAPAAPTTPPTPTTNPDDMGPAAAALQGFNSAIPFGERISAGLGAAGATAYEALTGADGPGLSGHYKDIRSVQEATAEANPLAYLGGAAGGIGNTIALGIPTKAATALAEQGGIRGAINAIPEALSSMGSWTRGGEVTKDASLGAKTANLAGEAVRSAAVAAPSGALYGYGGSRADLGSPEALADAKLGAGVGAGIGATVPVLGAVAGSVIPKVSDEVASLARAAKDRFGIDLSLDQIAPTKVRSTIQKVSQALPGSGVGSFIEKQRQQWTRAVAKTIGEEADNLGPETINNYLSRAKDDFNGVLADKTIDVLPSDIEGVKKIAETATRKVTGDVAQVVKNNVEDFLTDLGGVPQVAGAKLASLRSKILGELPSIDAQARKHVADIVDKIDEMIGRHISPEEAQTLATARNQWRNFRTLEPLLEKSPDGMINPTQLMQRVASSKFIKSSRKEVGSDDLVDLARIGKQFLGVKGGSDTAEKLITSGGIGAVGGTALYAPAAVPGMLAAEGGALALNRGFQKLYNQSPRLVAKAVGAAAKEAPVLGGATGAATGAADDIPTVTIRPSDKYRPLEEDLAKIPPETPFPQYENFRPERAPEKASFLVQDDVKALKKVVAELERYRKTPPTTPTDKAKLVSLEREAQRLRVSLGLKEQ